MSPRGASQNILRKKEWKCGRIGTNKTQSNHVSSWFLTNVTAQCYTRSSSKQDLHILYHLQLNCLGVNDIHNPHHVLKHQAQLLAVVWKETSEIFKLEATRISVKPSFLFFTWLTYDDGVDFALNLQGAAAAAKDVDNLFQLRLLNHQVVFLLKVLLQYQITHDIKNSEPKPTFEWI